MFPIGRVYPRKQQSTSRTMFYPLSYSGYGAKGRVLSEGKVSSNEHRQGNMSTRRDTKTLLLWALL